MAAGSQRTHMQATGPGPRPEHDQFLRQSLEPVEDLTIIRSAAIPLPLQHGIDLVEKQPPGIAVELALGDAERVDEGPGATQHRCAGGLRGPFAVGQLLREFLQGSQEHDVALLAGHELLFANLASVGPVVVVMTAPGKRRRRLLPHPCRRGRHERHRAFQTPSDPYAPQLADECRWPRRIGGLVAELDQPIPQHPFEP